MIVIIWKYNFFWHQHEIADFSKNTDQHPDKSKDPLYTQSTTVNNTPWLIKGLKGYLNHYFVSNEWDKNIVSSQCHTDTRLSAGQLSTNHFSSFIYWWLEIIMMYLVYSRVDILCVLGWLMFVTGLVETYVFCPLNPIPDHGGAKLPPSQTFT